MCCLLAFMVNQIIEIFLYKMEWHNTSELSMAKTYCYAGWQRLQNKIKMSKDVPYNELNDRPTFVHLG